MFHKFHMVRCTILNYMYQVNTDDCDGPNPDALGKSNEIFKVITQEDGAIVGGFCSEVPEFFAANNKTAEVKMLEHSRRDNEHGKIEELRG